MPFPDHVRVKLSMDAGGYCSLCPRYTGILDGRRTAGQAAHIVSESLDGPRGRYPLEAELRNEEANGIWLCVQCHTRVDHTHPQDYEVEDLRRDKEAAVARAMEMRGNTAQQFADQFSRPIAYRVSPADLDGPKHFLDLHRRLWSELDLVRFHSIPTLSPQIEHEIRILSNLGRTIAFRAADLGARENFTNDLELLSMMQQVELLVSQLAKSPLDYSPQRPTFLLMPAIHAYLIAIQQLAECIAICEQPPSSGPRIYRPFGT